MNGRTLGLATALCLTAASLAGCQKKEAQTAAAPAASSQPAAAEAQPQLTPGKVTSATATELVIASQDTPATFELTPQTTIMVAHKGSVADIKAGSFIGTTNVPTADGTGQSTEVHIFPPGVKMGEGDRPMGPAGPSATSRMTNGTVSAAAPAEASATRMTNGSVGQVAGAGAGVQMEVSYAGGKRQITVPADTPVMVMSSGTVDLLKPGTNVLVGALPGPDGKKTATFINVQP